VPKALKTEVFDYPTIVLHLLSKETLHKPYYCQKLHFAADGMCLLYGSTFIQIFMLGSKKNIIVKE